MGNAMVSAMAENGRSMVRKVPRIADSAMV
jgi:hypothetical protein